MSIEIFKISHFSKIVDNLFKKRKLLQDDYDQFIKELTKNPKSGDLISQTGGVRKLRLKSASKGKSGGFRICYLYIQAKGKIYLLYIFPKNEQENLTKEEKKILRDLTDYFKRYKT